MQVPFVVADDERVREARRRSDVAQSQRLLAPHLRAAVAVERDDGVEIVGHVDVVEVGPQARVGRHVLLPQHHAGLEVDADSPAVVTDDVDVVADDLQTRADVDQTLELAAAGGLAIATSQAGSPSAISYAPTRPLLKPLITRVPATRGACCRARQRRQRLLDGPERAPLVDEKPRSLPSTVRTAMTPRADGRRREHLAARQLAQTLLAGRGIEHDQHAVGRTEREHARRRSRGRPSAAARFSRPRPCAPVSASNEATWPSYAPA